MRAAYVPLMQFGVLAVAACAASACAKPTAPSALDRLDTEITAALVGSPTRLRSVIRNTGSTPLGVSCPRVEYRVAGQWTTDMTCALMIAGVKAGDSLVYNFPVIAPALARVTAGVGRDVDASQVLALVSVSSTAVEVPAP